MSDNIKLISIKETKNKKYSVFLKNNMKFLKKELIKKDKESIERLNNEIDKFKILNGISFIPKIVAYNNVNNYYIIYEYIEGTSLNNYKFNNVLEILSVLIIISNEVKKIHDRYIVHCDLKPDNILISNNNVYILDLDNAKYVGEKVDYGTFRYCSLAQLQGEKADFKFDIYALGIIMYELLTNKKAFDFLTKDNLIIEKKNNNLFISDFNNNVPSFCDNIIYKATNGLYNNIEEFKSDLLELKRICGGG